MGQTSLETKRLLLRPFDLNDAEDVRRMAGAREVALNTTTIPHPYEEGLAAEWIRTHPKRYKGGEAITYAICLRDSGELIGAIGLEINKLHHRAELGYWIGTDYWNQGYCTEAARALVEFGLQDLGLNRIGAMHFKRNPASGRVLHKIGFRQEGESRQVILKWGEYVDVIYYGILRTDLERR